MELIKRVSLYISNQHKQLIIAPIYYTSSGYQEQENCFTADYPMDIEQLGSEVMNNLNLFTRKEIDARGLKSTDWPAFKHGKIKTVKAFRESYLYITVAGVNAANIIFEIRGFPLQNSELNVTSDFVGNAKKEDIGKKITAVYQACVTGKLFDKYDLNH